jgi:hypothetical protein
LGAFRKSTGLIIKNKFKTKIMITIKQALVSNLVHTGMFESQALEVIAIAKEEMGNDLRLNDSIDDYNEIIIQLWIKSTRIHALAWILKNKPEAWFRPMFEKTTAELMAELQ